MTEITEVAEGVYRIDFGRVISPETGNRLRCSLVFFIVSDGQTALIETSPAAVTPSLFEAIGRLGYDPSELSHIILSHIHLDHAGAAGALAEQMPQVKVLVHKRGAQHLVQTAKLVEGTRQAYGEKFEDEYGAIIPVPERQVRAVDDGEVIRIGEKKLKIIYTPGHAPHHMCIFYEANQGLFSGDSLGVQMPGSNPIIIEYGFDLDATLESIDKISALKPEHIYASHGTAKREPNEFIQSVRTTTKDYGDIILQAMKNGESKEEMVRRLEAYQKEHSPPDLPPRVSRLGYIIPWYIAHFKRKGAI